jgi:hypothetical protein
MIDTDGPLSLIGGVQIGARTLLDKNLIRFCNIARLSQWRGGMYFKGSLTQDFRLQVFSLYLDNLNSSQTPYFPFILATLNSSLFSNSVSLFNFLPF